MIGFVTIGGNISKVQGGHKPSSILFNLTKFLMIFFSLQVFTIIKFDVRAFMSNSTFDKRLLHFYRFESTLRIPSLRWT